MSEYTVTQSSDTEYVITESGGAGPTGKSAYRIWLDAGNEGTEEDFLNALMGNTPYIRNIDTVSSTLIYVGFAQPGTANSDAAWKIKRVDIVGNLVSVRWANGESIQLTAVWNNRASLTYT